MGIVTQSELEISDLRYELHQAMAEIAYLMRPPPEWAPWRPRQPDNPEVMQAKARAADARKAITAFKHRYGIKAKGYHW